MTFDSSSEEEESLKSRKESSCIGFKSKGRGEGLLTDIIEYFLVLFEREMFDIEGVWLIAFWWCIFNWMKKNKEERREKEEGNELYLCRK